MGFDSGLFDVQQARRFRQSILLFVILATLPCYCVGAILLGVAPGDGDAQTDTRGTTLPPPNIQTLQAIASSTPTFGGLATVTLFPTFSQGTLRPTPPQFVPPSSTPVRFIPTPTLAPTITSTVSTTPSPTASPSSTATATSQAANRPPQFTTPPGNVTVEVGGSQTVTLSFSDPDGDPVSFTASSNDSAIAIIPLFGQTSFDVAGVAAGSTTVSITLQDTRGGNTPATINVTVTPPAQPNNDPTFTVEPLPITVQQGDSQLVTLQFSDPDGDTVTFTAVSNDPTIATTTQVDSVSFTVLGVVAGDTTITITLDDGRGGTDARTVAVSVTAP